MVALHATCCPNVFNNGTVVGVLDIDSEFLSTFDATDAEWLEKIAALIAV